MASPEVDDRAAADDHRDCGAHFAVVGEVLRERFLDPLEPGVANALNGDPCCHDWYLLSGSWPNGTPKEASLWPPGRIYTRSSGAKLSSSFLMPASP